jgi:hypothetical protein
VNELGLEHALEVRQGDLDDVLRNGIALRCRCGWEYVEPAPNRALRRRLGDAAVFGMAARAEAAWEAHSELNRG